MSIIFGLACFGLCLVWGLYCYAGLVLVFELVILLAYEIVRDFNDMFCNE